MGANNEAATGNLTIKESDLTFHEKVGGGASGDVYRVTWKSKKFGKIEAAAKKIPIIKESYVEERFINKIKCLQSLNHPNILTYYGHVITPNHLIIVTEYVRNGTLCAYLKNKVLPSELKLKLAIQATKGIKYLQDKNISYQDIKTSNLLIDSEHNLKISDFGIEMDVTRAKTKRFKDFMDLGMYSSRTSETFWF